MKLSQLLKDNIKQIFLAGNHQEKYFIPEERQIIIEALEGYYGTLQGIEHLSDLALCNLYTTIL
jgi:hypothetical protein